MEGYPKELAMMRRRYWFFSLSALVLACGPRAEPTGTGPGGKSDTGWVADTSFEVGADLEGTLTKEASGSYKSLATDRALQEQLVDRQIAFGKTTMAKHGYHLNQLAERVEILEVTDTDGTVKLTYRASVDLVHDKGRSEAIPTLEELDQLDFDVKLPLDPVGVYYRADENCAEGWGDHTLADYNYYYYFAPEKEECEEPLHGAKLTLREVYPARTVYPEYDRLLNALDDDGTRGFKAAILPNSGDDDPLDRFNAHKQMIENSLDLDGVESDDGKYVRYEWTDGEAPDQVKLVIDLFNPTKGWFTSTFRKALGEYQLVFYNGHSAYGTQPFLTEADAFSSDYQIIMMHSCRSYPYYTRQVFRAKATEADPSGFDLADVVATGKSSYPGDSPWTLEPLLEGLMEGIVAVHRGRPDEAPTWLSIVGKMNAAAWGILYGAAGVRSNSWQPATE
jgi:hypothetical protein